ncbi:MAG: hypothetical protein ACRDV7_00810, partial [Acidimicrobiia bacterium]
MTTAAAPVSRGVPRLGRLQVIGLLYGLLGLLLVAYLAPNIEPTDKAVTFEPPPDPANLSFDPRTLIVVVGLCFLLTAAASLAPARYERYARAGLIVSTVLLAPLVVVLALAWSEAPDTN